MKFKKTILVRQFERLDKRLQIIAYAIDGYCKHNFNIEILITSVYRKDSATHSRFCAFDFRIQSSTGIFVFTKEQLDQLKIFCKSIKYDTDRPAKPTLYIHENRHSNGIHSHVQVYPGKMITILNKD